jgi:uncharacterized membrane protein YfcA
MIYVYIALIGIVAGMVKGISGFGSSLVTIPLLTMVLGVERISEIVVIMISFNVILNLLLVKENNALKLSGIKDFYLIVIFGAIFTLVGLYGLKNINEEVIIYIAASLIFVAILVLAYNLYLPNRIHLKPSILLQIIAGSLSGIGNGIASIDGPPVVFYLSVTNTDKEKFKGTLATHFLVMGIIGVIFMMFLNMYSMDILVNLLVMTVFTVIGLIAGMRISRKLDEKTFIIVVLVILLVLDVKMIFF